MTATCVTCGATRGSFLLVGNDWLCLAHLPRMGRRANRDQAAGRQSDRPPAKGVNNGAAILSTVPGVLRPAAVTPGGAA